MKTAAISGAVIAALAVGALATPSFAQSYRAPYNSDCRRSDGTTGAVIGGIAGAILGSNLAAHHGGRSGGAAIGGVAGALLGNSIARGSQSCGAQGYSSGYSGYSRGYQDRSYGYAQPTYRYAQPTYAYAQPYYGGYDSRYGDNSYSRPRYDREQYRDQYRVHSDWDDEH